MIHRTISDDRSLFYKIFAKYSVKNKRNNRELLKMKKKKKERNASEGALEKDRGTNGTRPLATITGITI